MPSASSVVLGLSAAAAIAVGGSAESLNRKAHHRSSSDDIGRNIIPSDESLDRALHHFAPAFQHGVFPGPKDAVETLHDENPALARQIVAAAKRELPKRQAPSNTTMTTATTTDRPFTNTSPTSFTTPSPVSNQQTTTAVSPTDTFVPPPPTTTSTTFVFIPGNVTSVTDSSTNISPSLTPVPVTNSVFVPITSINCQGQTSTGSTAIPAVIYQVTGTDGVTSFSTQTLAAVPATQTQDCTPLVSTAPTAIVTTTLPPPASGVKNSLIVETTEVAGSAVVVTRTLVVLPTNATPAQAQPADTTQDQARPTPSLQDASGVSSTMRTESFVLLAAALAFVLLI